jgi:hypothetical protein
MPWYTLSAAMGHERLSSAANDMIGTRQERALSGHPRSVYIEELPTGRAEVSVGEERGAI